MWFNEKSGEVCFKSIARFSVYAPGGGAVAEAYSFSSVLRQ